MRRSTGGPVNWTSSTPLPSSIFTILVMSYNDLMTTLPELSTRSTYHLQIGDNFTADHAANGRRSFARTFSRLIWYWRMSLHSANILKAGGTRCLSWAQHLRSIFSSSEIVDTCYNNKQVSQLVTIWLTITSCKILFQTKLSFVNN